MTRLVHDVGGKNERAVGIVRRILPIAWLIAMLGFCGGAQAAPPRERSPRVAPEEIVLHGFDADGNELALRVPAGILLAQLQQPGNTTNINLSQIAGTAVSTSLYDSGNNALKVNCIVGCSGAASFTDNSAFTTGSTSVTNVSGLFNDTATNLTSGNAGAIRATTDRMLFVNIGKINGTAPTLTGSSLNVNCTGGCSGAGFTDNSAFSAGTTTETNIGGVFNDGLTALSSGNAAAARITPNRGVHVNLRNNGGTEIATSSNPLRIDPTGTTTQPVSGTVTANVGTTNGLALDTSVNGILNAQASTTSGEKGPLDQCAVTTAAPAYTTAQTDPLSCDTSGNLRVNVTNTTAVNLTQVSGNALLGAGVSGTQAIGGTVAAGSAVGGGFPVQVAGEASGNVTRFVICDNFKPINISTATTTIIIPLVAAKTTYICGWHLYAAGADSVALVYGTGTTCGTGTLGIAGGTTAATGYSMIAQSNVTVQVPTGSPVKETVAANDTCIITSAAVQLSGIISYTQF